MRDRQTVRKTEPKKADRTERTATRVAEVHDSPVMDLPPDMQARMLDVPGVAEAQTLEVMLELQRDRGNRYVQRLVDERAVQRQPVDPGEAERESQIRAMFDALVAGSVRGAFAALSASPPDARQAYDSVVTAADTAGDIKQYYAEDSVNRATLNALEQRLRSAQYALMPHAKAGSVPMSEIRRSIDPAGTMAVWLEKSSQVL